MRGVVSYYLKHYVACFFNERQGVWYSFDDVSVHEIGRDWKKVIKHAKRGHAKPVLVFYQRVGAEDEDNTPSPIVGRANYRSLLDRMREHGTVRVAPK